MSIRLGIVMDPIGDIHFKKDTSLAMLLAAQPRGWELFIWRCRICICRADRPGPAPVA